MMYQATVTVPKDTASDSPLEFSLKINKGLIYKADIYIPAGHNGYTGIAVFDGLFQLWPTTPFEFIKGDNLHLNYDEAYFKMSVPYELRILAYNESDQYEHTMFVRVYLVTSEILMSRFLPALSYEKYTETIAGLLAEQEEEKAKIIAAPWTY